MPLQLSDKVLALAAQAHSDLRSQFDRIDAIAEKNTCKVLAAFQKHRVAEDVYKRQVPWVRGRLSPLWTEALWLTVDSLR